MWHRPGVSPAQRSPARTRPLRRVRAASMHADADQCAPHRTPTAQNRQCIPATAYPALSYSVASTLNKGAAGMQLVEAGLHAMSDSISQRPNRESPEKGGCGDAACGSWPASDSASSNTSTAISQNACYRGSAGKQLVEAGLRAIGTSVQQILFILHFSHASASAALSTVMRGAAYNRLRDRTARRARRCTRCT